MIVAKEPINNVLINLVPGSVVVVVNSSAFVAQAQRINSGILIYEFTDTNEEENLSHTAMRVHLGKVPVKNPKMHFQIDMLYLGERTKQSTVQQLREYVHIGGMIVYPDGSYERYFPSPVWDIPFAKLKPSEKLFLAQRISTLKENEIFVEIGSYKGGSAVLAAAVNPQCKIYAIDIWREDLGGVTVDFSIWRRHTQFFKSIKPIKIDIERLYEGPEFIARMEGISLSQLKINLLFIDGDHSYNGLINDLSIYDKYSLDVCGHDFSIGNSVHMATEDYYSRGFRKLILKSVPRKIKSRLLKFIQEKNVVYPKGDSTIWHRNNCAHDSGIRT